MTCFSLIEVGVIVVESDDNILTAIERTDIVRRLQVVEACRVSTAVDQRVEVHVDVDIVRTTVWDELDLSESSRGCGVHVAEQHEVSTRH